MYKVIYFSCFLFFIANEFSLYKGGQLIYFKYYIISFSAYMIHTSLNIYLKQKEALLIRQCFFLRENQNVYCLTIVLPAITTALVLANAFPSKLAPVLKVIACMANTLPFITEVVPKVADVPTCQQIFDA